MNMLWRVYVSIVDMFFDHVQFDVIMILTLMNFDQQNLIVNMFVDNNLEGNVYYKKNVKL